MKHLEDTPWWICDPEDTNYCAYVDTDSNYFHAEPLLRHRFPNFDEMSDKEKDTELEKIAIEYQDKITNHYNNVAKDVFNINQFEWFDKPHWLEMKTECVIRSAYFRATRRYAQWITKQEGVEKETLDIKGLEFQKANFPPILGEFFHKALVDVLKGTKQDESEATYCKRRKPEESEITIDEIMNKSAHELYDKVRMLNDPYPNAFIRCKNGDKLFITKTHYNDSTR